MVIPVCIFLVFSAMHSITSSGVQILIIVNLHLVSLNLVVSSSVFRIIIDIFLLESVTKLILPSHSLVFFLSTQAAFPIPAATTFWPVS